MARIRTIKPDFAQSESMGQVSRDARLLFVQLWTFADDSGRARGNSRMLASVLFPFDDDAPGLIDDWLMDLERENCIVRYKVDGTTYLQITNWEKHQKIDKPTASKIPPPGSKTEVLTNPREPSLNISEPSITEREEEREREEDIRDPDGSLVEAQASTVNLQFERDRNKLAEDRDKLRALGEQWNAVAGQLRLPQIESIDPGSRRERAALARIRDDCDFDRVFAKIRASPFLRGDRGSTPASFDWITNPTNYQKIIEGNYDEIRQAQRR